MRVPAALPLLICCVSAFGEDYTTYIGDQYPCYVSAIATDSHGNTYITGSRALSSVWPGIPLASIFVPKPDPADILTAANGQTDIFVGKLDASGHLTQLATLSGKSQEQANGIAVDPNGNIWIVGWTRSANFPLHQPLQSTPGTGMTGFLVKLNPDGGILFSTYLGGTTGYSLLNAVVADSNGNVYVTGSTTASDYPHTAGLPAGSVFGGSFGEISGAFFAKIASAGDEILYAGTLSSTGHACGVGSTCFTSAIHTSGTAIAVDPAGNAYIAGNTRGSGLPTTPGALKTEGIGAFVAKVNSTGTGLVYSTLLGSANYIPPPVVPNSSPGNFVFAIAADAAGNALITGSTSDPAFPVTPSAFQTQLSAPIPNNPYASPPSDAFIAKLNPSGSAMVWATFLGGAGSDQGQTIATDPAGNVWVSGITSSSDFPNSPSGTNGSEFLVELNSLGSALAFTDRFPANVVAAALAMDASGTLRASGANGLVSAFAPTIASGQIPAPRLFGISNAAGGTISGRIAPGELISIYGRHFGPATPVSAKFDSAGFLPVALAGIQVTINGINSPLLYVSDTQINAVAPVGLTPGSTVIRMTINGASLPDFRAMVDPSAPQVFRNADGSAVVINSDGTVNSAANPAKAGSSVSIWGTGAGGFPGSDGQMAMGPEPLFCCEIHLTDGTSFRDTNLDISYEGAAPGTVNGVLQMNFQTPLPSSTSFRDRLYYLAVRGRVGEPLTYSDPFLVFLTP